MRLFPIAFVLIFLTSLIGLGTPFSVRAENKTVLRSKWTGDFDEMVKEKKIRALIPYSKTFYYLDGPTQKGLLYDAMVQFEKYLNEQQQTKHLKVKVIVIPTPRNKLLSDLQEGYGDIAVGNLTVTEARRKLVDFSNPPGKPIDELLVTGKDQTSPENLFDVAGMEIFMRKSSSYYESLVAFNKQLESLGKKPVTIVESDEYLEDEDLLEMVNAGIIPAVVVDSHKAELWAKVYENIVVHEDIKFRSGGQTAWAFRKNSPKLKKEINDFLDKNRKGTLLYNMLYKRYFGSASYLKDNTSEAERKKFEQTIAVFQKYADQYDFDFLLLMAQAYQESLLDNSKRSHAGAIGIMQILPSTAKDPNVNIANIEQLENNVHAGTKYLHFMINRYFSNEKMDRLNKGLFAFASYNAGPAKVRKLRAEAEKEGLDPNVWFNNVEIIAAKRIGRETVQYVSNIYKYYVAYKLIYNKKLKKKVGKVSLQKKVDAN